MVKEFSANEEIKKFRFVRIVRRPFGAPMDGPHTKYCLCKTFLYIVVTPEFYITQCLECLSFQEHIPERFQDCLQTHNSGQPLPDLSTIFWRCASFVAAELQQNCRVLANKIQCLGSKITTAWLLYLPDETNLFIQQEFLKGNEGAQAQNLVACVVGNAVAHES